MENLNVIYEEHKKQKKTEEEEESRKSREREKNINQQIVIEMNE